MDKKVIIEKLYKEINVLNESLELIDLFLIFNRLLKKKTHEDNDVKEEYFQQIITKYGNHLNPLVTELLMDKRDKDLMIGAEQSHQAEKALSQLKIMKILFEERVKRIKKRIDQLLEGTKEES